MAHGLLCTCKKCSLRLSDVLFGGGSKKGGGFSKKLSDGTKIYGPKSTEGRPGHKHGHKGSNFSRTPHSTIGSAATGRPHTQKGHKTDRW